MPIGQFLTFSLSFFCSLQLYGSVVYGEGVISLFYCFIEWEMSVISTYLE
jgi:hypothetical protein